MASREPLEIIRREVRPRDARAEIRRRADTHQRGEQQGVHEYAIRHAIEHIIMSLLYVQRGRSTRGAADPSSGRVREQVSRRADSRPKEMDVTDQERQKVEDLISRLEIAVGQLFPRD